MTPSWLLKIICDELADAGYCIVQTDTEEKARKVAEGLSPRGATVDSITQIGPMSDALVGPEWRDRFLTQAEYEELNQYRQAELAKQVGQP